MIKSYSVHSIPADVQPATFAEGWLRKVLILAQCKETVDDYSVKVRNGSSYRVFFELKEES